MPTAALKRRNGYVPVVAGLFLLSIATNLPTSLYQLYATTFSLSPWQISVVYATYGVCVIPALLLFGVLSDRIGRRRVLIIGALATAAATTAMALSYDMSSLLIGRVLQAIAVGAYSGTGVATLVEFHPRQSREDAGLAAAMSQTLGGATGPLLGAGFATLLPNPLVVSYLAVGALAILVVFVFARLPDTPPASPASIRATDSYLPVRGRALYFAACVTGALTWSLGGLFMALMPGYVSDVLGRTNVLAGGLVATIMLTISAAAQLAFRRMASVHLQSIGLAGLIVGLSSVVAGDVFRLMPVLIVAAVVCGIGFGCGYLGSVVTVNHVARPESRGTMTSVFYSVAYAGGSLPIVGLGVIASMASTFGAVAIYSAAAAAISALVLVWLLRQRTPRQLFISAPDADGVSR